MICNSAPKNSKILQEISENNCKTANLSKIHKLWTKSIKSRKDLSITGSAKKNFLHLHPNWTKLSLLIIYQENHQLATFRNKTSISITATKNQDGAKPSDIKSAWDHPNKKTAWSHQCVSITNHHQDHLFSNNHPPSPTPFSENHQNN